MAANKDAMGKVQHSPQQPSVGLVESKLKREIDLSQYLSVLGDVEKPTEFLFARDVNQSCEPIKVKDFFRDIDPLAQHYAGSLFIKKEEYEKFREYCIQLIVRDLVKCRIKISSAQLKKFSKQTASKLKLKDIGAEVSVSGFAKDRIMPGEILLYGGEIVGYEKKELDEVGEKLSFHALEIGPMYDNRRYVVDAKSIRDFAGYFAHLSSEANFDKNYETPSAGASRFIAKANFVPARAFVEDLGIIVTVLIALRVIEPEEVVGFDYDEPVYFDRAGIDSRLMMTSGHLLPQSLYNNQRLILTFYLPNGAHITLKAISWSEFASHSQQLKIFDPGNELLVVLTHRGITQTLAQYGSRHVSIACDGYIDRRILNLIIEKILEVLDSQIHIGLGIRQKGEKVWKIDFNDLDRLVKLMLDISGVHTEFESMLKEAGLKNDVDILSATLGTQDIKMLCISAQSCCHLALHYHLLDRAALEKLREKEKPVVAIYAGRTQTKPQPQSQSQPQTPLNPGLQEKLEWLALTSLLHVTNVELSDRGKALLPGFDLCKSTRQTIDCAAIILSTNSKARNLGS